MKAQEREQLLRTLKARFGRNMHRHKEIQWDAVRARIEGNPAALRSLREMERTGGEPDVIGRAGAKGIDLLAEDQYRELQKLGEFDTKTSSWINTPPEVRALGGALFCDRRYGKVFVYHNGAQSYYAARGFRGTLRV